MEVKIKDKDGFVEADWTIEDGILVVSPKEVKFEPKDGDVVYVKTNHENIIIYKEQSNKFGRYVNYIDKQELYTHVSDFCGSYADIIEIRPATEEEKQKLFDKIAEEGYEFDFEKKELIKLKWRPKIGETYYRPDFFHCEFICYSGITDYDKIVYIKDHIENGWCFKTKEECEQFCNRLNNAINSVKP